MRGIFARKDLDCTEYKAESSPHGHRTLASSRSLNPTTSQCTKHVHQGEKFNY